MLLVERSLLSGCISSREVRSSACRKKEASARLWRDDLNSTSNSPISTLIQFYSQQQVDESGIAPASICNRSLSVFFFCLCCPPDVRTHRKRIGLREETPNKGSSTWETGAIGSRPPAAGCMQRGRGCTNRDDLHLLLTRGLCRTCVLRIIWHHGWCQGWYTGDAHYAHRKEIFPRGTILSPRTHGCAGVRCS
jgi:hypothetical protein